MVKSSAVVTRQLVKKRLGTLRKPSRSASGEAFGQSASGGQSSDAAATTAPTKNTGAPMEWLIDGDDHFVPPAADKTGVAEGQKISTGLPTSAKTGKVPDYVQTGLDYD